ncbi:hypothetical protein PN462_21560 [Spirulina sp. CS-785/01]|uniref:FitA-like ribbon-helix-helix domain-containing protein n=1 Tax=Spirulina sp. CS-785/01 TaxID=3021716 RepID=UPI00232F89B4|nr:hypothetical protein [Spirulina sp. CS-785/01]MDB9315716.1 hypothetical protein [Spirulina sp. CS-785/01]
MAQIILEKIKPSLIEQLEILARANDRSLEEEIMAILERVLESEVIIHPDKAGWQPGFFEEVIGGWQGKPLEREPQPQEQERELLL